MIAKDIDSSARAAAGNWRKFDSFIWEKRIEGEDMGDWGIFYTSNRDSKLLELSNSAQIELRMRPYLEGKGALDDEYPDCVAETHSHWAVGYVMGYSIRVYSNGKVTEAFKEWENISLKLSEYPILNEEAYSEMELESTLENIEAIIRSIIHDDFPNNYVDDVYSYLSEKDCGCLENIDDNGGYPSDDLVLEALMHLGFIP